MIYNARQGKSKVGHLEVRKCLPSVDPPLKSWVSTYKDLSNVPMLSWSKSYQTRHVSKKNLIDKVHMTRKKSPRTVEWQKRVASEKVTKFKIMNKNLV